MTSQKKLAPRPRIGIRQAAIRAFRDGEVLAYPTESCYGLGCDPFNDRALKKILAIKRRPNHKGMIVIASDMAQIRPLIQPLTKEQEAILAQYWPGPYTFLLPASPKVLPLLRGRHQKIAVRLTAHPDTVGLCQTLGHALVSTSANQAGKRSLKTSRACQTAFENQVLVIGGRIGKRRKPSTIIDLETMKVLR